MTTAITITNWVAFILALSGSGVCFYYWRRCVPEKRIYRLYAALVLLYFSFIYSIALIAPHTILFDLVRNGILTRIGVIALIGLLIGWVISENGLCKRGR